MRKVITTIALIATVLFAISQNTNQSEKLINENFALEKSRFVNDTIWFLDSTLFQRNTDSGFIDTERSIILSHDSEGRITSQINQYMNLETNQWTNKSFDSIIFYPGSNSISEKFYSVWNTNENNWKLTIYNKKNEDGSPILAYQKGWDNTQNQYNDGYQERWEYNDLGDVHIYYWEKFNTESQEFENNARRTYYYNELSHDTTYIIEKWNKENQSWKNSFRKDFLYNTKGFISQSMISYWKGDPASWQKESLTTNSFNIENFADTTVYYFWLEDMQVWYPDYRTIFSYYENAMEKEILRQDCLFPADNFVNANRIIYTYENNKLVEERKQVWAGAENWRDDRINLFTYVYDSLFESQTMVSYDEYTHLYDTAYKFLTLYDEKPLAVATLTQSWSSEISDFVITSQRLYYWGSLTSPDAINEYSNFEFSVYPNPSSGIFKIELPESPGTTSSIVISDLNGRILFNDLISSKQSVIDLSRETKGIYFIQIISGNKRGVKQVIKY